MEQIVVLNAVSRDRLYQLIAVAKAHMSAEGPSIQLPQFERRRTMEARLDKDKSIIAAIVLAFLLVITFAGGWPAIWEAFAVLATIVLIAAASRRS